MMSERRSNTEETRIAQLQSEIVSLSQLTRAELQEHPYAHEVFTEFRDNLDNGSIRAAEKKIDGTWSVNTWVKQGILVGMRLGDTVPMSSDEETLQFFDKDTLPLKQIDRDGTVRIVPGGTSIRAGSFIEKGVIIMPPSYINIGAYVGKGTLLDSNSLVGSCAQVGEGCHIAAGAQIGGVLEPVNANPCIVEDDVVMGINTSIAEGVILKSGVVLAPGVQITSATPVYDVVREEIYTSENGPLTIPEGAVVVPGVRLMRGNSEFITENGLMIQTPIIRKYRDTSTDAKTAIESALR